MEKQPIIDFSSYITDKTENFTGREWVFKGVDEWLGKRDGPRFFLLTGEPGCGKTAISARLTQFAQREVNPPDGLPHFTPAFLNAIHFCSARDSLWIDPRNFARSLSLQLTYLPEFAQALKDVGDREINMEVHQEAQSLHGQMIGINITNLDLSGLNAQDAFNRAVLEPLQIIYGGKFNQPLIILVDALDESLAHKAPKGDVNIVRLLSGLQNLSAQVRFILTSRPDARVESEFLEAEGLFLSAPEYTDRNLQDISDYVHQRLSQEDNLREKMAQLSPAQGTIKKDMIFRKSEGNFQYVTFLLNAIAKGQQSLDDLDALPPGLDGLYHESLMRVVDLGRKQESEYKKFLGVLSVAQENLSLAQLQGFTGQNERIAWELLGDLWQFVEATQLKKGQKLEDYYRLYHQSVIDFLRRRLLVLDKKRLPNHFYLPAEEWHEQVILSYKGAAANWQNVKWPQMDGYGLRYLVTHLYALRENEAHRQDLHNLVQTELFRQERLKRWWNPNPFLDDLRLALELAIKDDDLAQVWKHILLYRSTVRGEQDFRRIMAAVAAGKFAEALERTNLYASLPNSQAWTRLWIAWDAAAKGEKEMAAIAVSKALSDIAPRVIMTRMGLGNKFDAIDEAQKRLLVRVVRSIATTEEEKHSWLEQALAASLWSRASKVWWPGYLQSFVQRLTEPLNLWREAFNSKWIVINSIPILKISDFFNSRNLENWQNYVKEMVDLINLNDNTSYREIALAWVAAAVLAHESEKEARAALAIVLSNIFSQAAPGFWGDTIAATLEGRVRETKDDLDDNSLLDQFKHIHIDPTIEIKFDEGPSAAPLRKKMGLPQDPWSLLMRRQGAVAAVLHRQNEQDKKTKAEALLQEAMAQDHKESYAGFRALARLSLACRWLEWGVVAKAKMQIEAAQTDAANMLDDVLRQERLDMVDKMRKWVAEFDENQAQLNYAEALERARNLTGMERNLYLEFLSAVCYPNADLLKQLLPLSLDDAITTDAVLGRLLGSLAADKRPDLFDKLVNAMGLGRIVSDLIRQTKV